MNDIELVKFNSQTWTEIKGLSSKGKRVKGLYENPEGTRYIYKEPKRLENGFLTCEIWTEIIANNIGKLIGLNTPSAQPAQYEVMNSTKQDGSTISAIRCGILIENFIAKENDFLTHANDMLPPSITLNPETLKYQSTSHNLVAIEDRLSQIFMQSDTWNEFKKMLVFDTLIGNVDRHGENWGVGPIFTPKGLKIKLSPIYDNASCLTYNLDEDQVLELLQNGNRLDAYVSKCRPPNLYLSSLSVKHVNHYEIMEYLIKNESNMKDLINSLVATDYLDHVCNIMENIQRLDVPASYKLSDNRKELILQILKIRKEKLRQIL